MENLYTPNCIRTFTGIYINVFEPTLEMICVITKQRHIMKNLFIALCLLPVVASAQFIPSVGYEIGIDSQFPSINFEIQQGEEHFGISGITGVTNAADFFESEYRLLFGGYYTKNGNHVFDFRFGIKGNHFALNPGYKWISHNKWVLGADAYVTINPTVSLKIGRLIGDMKYRR